MLCDQNFRLIQDDKNYIPIFYNYRSEFSMKMLKLNFNLNVYNPSLKFRMPKSSTEFIHKIQKIEIYFQIHSSKSFKNLNFNFNFNFSI